jgi:hypothetical protein
MSSSLDGSPYPTPHLSVILSEITQGNPHKKVYVKPQGCGLYYCAENNMKIAIQVRNETVRENVRQQQEERKSGGGAT